MYHCFAGRDATVGLAMGSVNIREWESKSAQDLSMFEQDALDQWYATFYSKYEIVGRMHEVHHTAPTAARRTVSDTKVQ